MAATTKTTSTLNIILQDSMNGDVIFKIDNPDDGINLSGIKSVFDPVIYVSLDSDPDILYLLCTKTGNNIISVVGAEKVTTVVTKETIE